MLLFALFAHSRSPALLLALTGLLITALAVTSSFRGNEPVVSIFGLATPSRAVLWWILPALTLGAGLSILFRWTEARALLPESLHLFLLVAASIGAAEELLFRGFIQGRLRPLGWPAAVFLAAAAHAGYKVALFVFPPEEMVIRYGTLGLWTLGVGVVLGLMRHHSRSVIPPLAAHALFDILVYGDWSQAPWWVWG
jgi:membrane protease YdiL (CAAX protease family)